MWGWHYDMGWGWWVVGPLMMALFWGGLFWLGFLLIRGNERRADDPGLETPEEIARRRLANGEIDVDEFERIMNQLNKNRSGTHA